MCEFTLCLNWGVVFELRCCVSLHCVSVDLLCKGVVWVYIMFEVKCCMSWQCVWFEVLHEFTVCLNWGCRMSLQHVGMEPLCKLWSIIQTWVVWILMQHMFCTLSRCLWYISVLMMLCVVSSDVMVFLYSQILNGQSWKPGQQPEIGNLPHMAQAMHCLHHTIRSWRFVMETVIMNTTRIW